MRLDCLMAGVGGQGTVLASKLLAQAAICAGAFARTSETIGMAQRGGSVASHVRIGEGAASPLIPEGGADLIIGFEPSEAVRNLRYLKPGGRCIVAADPVAPVTASLGQGNYDVKKMLRFLQQQVAELRIVDAAALSALAGSPKTRNLILLGVALGEGWLGLPQEAIVQAIQIGMPEKLWQINCRALELGMDYEMHNGRCEATW